MALKMLYILPMILGRTFDARNDRVGIDIFPQSELDKMEVNDAPIMDSSYKMVKDSQEVKKILDVSGDFSLKVKSGKLDLKGIGNYLKSTSSNEKTVEILTKMKYYTSTRSLPFSLKPYSDWASHRMEDLGTHYVQSITYGGELIASLRFIAHKIEDVQSIEAKVSSEIQGMQLKNLVASGKLNQLKKDLQDKANMEISYFATVPLKDVPNTLEGLQKLVEGFDEQVKKINKGAGVPVRVELVELSNFDSRFQFLKNRALETALKTFEEQFDDLRTTREELTEWIRSLPPTISDKQEAQINKFYKRIRNILRVFHHTIGIMDIEKGTDQLTKAQRAYKEDKSAIPGKFKRDFERLQSEINIPEYDNTDVGKSTYVRWGHNSCNSSTSSTLYGGHVASGEEFGVGGGSNYLCLPSNAELVSGNIPSDKKSGSYLGGVRYGITELELFEGSQVNNMFGNGVLCSLCHVGNRSTIFTQLGSHQCPDGWIQEYYGYLTANRDSGHRSRYICLDHLPEYQEAIKAATFEHSLNLVGMNENEQNVAVACTVCSK